MALTNPNKLIDVQRLERFKQKCDVEYSKTYASTQTCEDIISELT